MKNAIATIPSQAWSIGLGDQPEVLTRPARAGLHDSGPYQGAPLGGFGTGGIGRSYQGAFNRWTVKTGAVKDFCLPVNLFSVRTKFDGEDAVATALHPGYPRQHPGDDSGQSDLSAWNWSYSGQGAAYHALYPKAWYHYPQSDELAVELLCEQFSPILPGRYRETGLPVGVFDWTVRNPHDRAVDVSLMFSFTNMVGWFCDFSRIKPHAKSGGNCNRLVETKGGCGIVMERAESDLPLQEGLGQFCIMTRSEEGMTVTRRVAFQSSVTDGRDIWTDFLEDGCLNDRPGYRGVPEADMAGAICVKVRLEPGESRSVPMVLSWDLPLIRFGKGREHWRQYTKHFGRTGQNAAAIAEEALKKFPEWSQEIDRWHQDVFRDNPGMPDSFFPILFNESYMAVDGLTVWTDGTRDRPGEDSIFAVIECPDYPYYCTLDLWIYGSFLFMRYWPELEKNVIRRLADGVFREDEYFRTCMSRGHLFKSNISGAAPHDLGDPNDDPVFTINNYSWQEANKWKDLNCQLILNIYRDVVFLDDDALLKETWPAVKAALEYLKGFDTDHDGLIENDGTPDQTMDNIPMKGPSCYCGGLWLGAISAAVKMAGRIRDHEFLEKWEPMADTARRSFEEKLWTGTHYRLDADGDSPEALFADGMFGIWFSRLCGLADLIPDEHYREHLRKVYHRNFYDANRELGAVNITGWQQASQAGESNFNTDECQRGEVLYGLNLSLAGQLRDAGLAAESDELLDCLYRTVYGKFGLWFRSPAAWTRDARFRAVFNLRPLIIWAMVKGNSIANAPL
ncbi:MAG: GH116 family glycosyl hydrolase [Kiritimatiellales bacterium]